MIIIWKFIWFKRHKLAIKRQASTTKKRHVEYCHWQTPLKLYPNRNLKGREWCCKVDRQGGQAKAAIFSLPMGARRPHGRPRTSWCDDITNIGGIMAQDVAIHARPRPDHALPSNASTPVGRIVQGLLRWWETWPMHRDALFHKIISKWSQTKTCNPFSNACFSRSRFLILYR